MTEFKTKDNLKRASAPEIAKAAGINLNAAQQLSDMLNEE